MPLHGSVDEILICADDDSHERFERGWKRSIGATGGDCCDCGDDGGKGNFSSSGDERFEQIRIAEEQRRW